MDILGSIVGNLIERFIDPTINQFRYLIFFRNNVESLRNEIENLELKKADVHRMVDEAIKNDYKIKEMVTRWLKQADDLKQDAYSIFQDRENVKVNCFKIIRLPNLKRRYLVGRRAAKKGNDVKEHLKKEWQSDEVGYLPPLGKMPFSQSNSSFEESLITRMSKKKEVIDALMQEKTCLLAVCGMGGVGKTFLIEQIADQVKSGKLFDCVAFATVSQNPDMRNVQNDLAVQLGLKLISSEQSDRARAERLYTRLTDSPEQRNLLILDDIWKEVDLRSLGIPVRWDESCKSLKVLLTSRFSHVCRNMGAEIIEVNALPKEEAWNLFKNAAGISDDSAFNNVARQVAEECKGLPLAIVVVARALKGSRNATLESWKLALRQLKKYTMRDLEGVQDLVFSRIQWSYDRLESVEAKSLLLFCSLFPEDYSIPIECLVRYGKGMQMFQNRETLGDVRFRVDQLINDLKSCYLLLADGGKEDYVKLHDVVRDVCLKIASEGEHVFLVKNVGGEEVNSRLDFPLGHYTAISLTWLLKPNSIGLFPLGDCPKLRLLRLVFPFGKKIYPSLSKDTFQGMEDLKVMELNNMEIGFTPSVPGRLMLMSLRTLCLDNCELYTGTSSMLGYMTQLENLSFYCSKFLEDEFPKEIAQMSNLKLLDLRFRGTKARLSPIILPLGTLSSLKKLEELYTGVHRNLQLGENAEEERECIKEIASLAYLECLQIDLHKKDLMLVFLREFPVERLLRFDIESVHGSFSRNSHEYNYQFRRNFELFSLSNEEDELASNLAFASIIRRSEKLILGYPNLSRSRVFLNDLDESGFVNLKTLTLESGSWECLIDSATNLPSRPVFENLVYMKLVSVHIQEICRGNLPLRSFSQLQEMNLMSMDDIKYLWKGPIEPPSLCNLRLIKVRECNRLTTLFSQSVFKCLVKLQEIDISDCRTFENIVMREENMKERVLVLPQLKVLTITGIEGFSSQDDTCSRAFLNKVSLPRLESLTVSYPKGPEQFVGGDMLKGSLENLRSLTVSDCYFIRYIAKADSVALFENLQNFSLSRGPSVELVFDLEGLKVPIHSEKGSLEILPNLRSLDLIQLPRLTHILRNHPKGLRVFQNLRRLEVLGCNTLPYVFYPPCVANMLVSLEKLSVGRCGAMRGVIGRQDIGETSQEEDHGVAENEREIAQERTNKKQEFLFPKLSSLSLVHLQNLHSFSVGNHKDCDFKFPSLTELEIMDCPELKSLCSGKLDAPLLKKVKLVKDEASVPQDLKDREVIFFTNGEISWNNRDY